MYVKRTPGLGSFFTDIRNMAENAVATYYPALRPLVAKAPQPSPPPPPPQAAAPVPARVERAVKHAASGLSTPLIIGGGVALAGLAAFFLMKKKGR